MKRKIADLLATTLFVLGTLVLLGQVPNFSQNMPANTVLARLGVGPGPVQAVPFATFVANLGLPAAVNGALSVYVSPSGSDSNNCTSLGTPCGTIDHAITLCSMGITCTINLGAGTYNTSTGYNFNYYTFYAVRGDCGNPGNVIINATANSIAIFNAQDHVILTIGCITFTTNATGVIIANARQMAIVDFSINQISSAFVNGTVLASTTHSSMNCTTSLTFTVAPSLSVIATTSVKGVITYGCPTILQVAGGTITNYFVASGKSLIDSSVATWSGAGAGTNTTGNQCNLTDSTLLKPGGGLAAIPGNSSSCVLNPATDAATGAPFVQ